MESDTAHAESQSTFLLVVGVCPQEQTHVTVWPLGLSPYCMTNLHLMYLNNGVQAVEDYRVCIPNPLGPHLLLFDVW